MSQQAAKKVRTTSGSAVDVVQLSDLHGGPALASLETDTNANEIPRSASAAAETQNIEQLVESLSDSLEFSLESTLVAVGTGQFTHSAEAVIRGQ